MTDLAFFGHALDQYHTEHKEALAIEPETRLGLLLVDKKILKEMLESSPLRCLEVRTSYRAHLDYYWFILVHLHQ